MNGAIGGIQLLLSLCVVCTTLKMNRKRPMGNAATNHWTHRIYQYNIFYYYCHWMVLAVCAYSHRYCHSNRSFFTRRKARFWINCRWKFAFQVIVILSLFQFPAPSACFFFHSTQVACSFCYSTQVANVVCCRSMNISTRLMYKVTLVAC